jgi:hypothetical protein
MIECIAVASPIMRRAIDTDSMHVCQHDLMSLHIDQ